MITYPTFKYHPNAYGLDIFAQETGICNICGQHRELKYDCSFYAQEYPDYICPFCIADGSASQKYDGEFNDYTSIESVSPNPSDPKSPIDPALLEEICCRTPSYTSWQQAEWKVHCNEPCAFIDYADVATITPLLDELEEDIQNDGYPPEFIKTCLSKDGDLVGYLFQCVVCGKHRLHVDMC